MYVENFNYKIKHFKMILIQRTAHFCNEVKLKHHKSKLFCLSYKTTTSNRKLKFQKYINKLPSTYKMKNYYYLILLSNLVWTDIY